MSYISWLVSYYASNEIAIYGIGIGGVVTLSIIGGIINVYEHFKKKKVKKKKEKEINTCKDIIKLN